MKKNLKVAVNYLDGRKERHSVRITEPRFGTLAHGDKIASLGGLLCFGALVAVTEVLGDIVDVLVAAPG